MRKFISLDHCQGLLAACLLILGATHIHAASSAGTPDYADSVVNGAEDLKDFFPVFLDIKQLISAMPPSSGVKYKLKQEDAALNFVYTNLTRANAYGYLSAPETGFGPSFNQPATMATTQQVIAAGVELSEDFLNRIKDQNQGVILCEGRTFTTKPLVLAVEKDGAVIAEVKVYLTAVDASFVDRDNPATVWASARKLRNETLYAGTESGDMVSWKVPLIAGASYAWQASGPGGAVVNGPSGPGKNEWRIADSDDDPDHNWLDWKPGTYKISCVIQGGAAPQTVTFNQEIGWRTNQYLVAGQVRPINDFTLSSAQESTLKADLIADLTPGSTPQAARDALALLPVDQVMLAWFTYYSIPPRRNPDLPNTTEDMRLWMVQTMLNNNPDDVILPNALPTGSEALGNLLSKQSYRMLSAVQVKYRVSSTDKIEGVTLVAGSLSRIGPTKIELNDSIVSVLGLLGQPQNGSQLLIPASPNPNTDQVQIDQAGRRISLYTSGRVGFEGRHPNWAIFGRDVPYIYTEIIFGLDADGRDTQNTVRLSVDKVWMQDGPESGEHYFNEIRIYRRRPPLPEQPFQVQIVYPLGQSAQMLRPFIFRVPEGQWPTEITVPTVPNSP